MPRKGYLDAAPDTGQFACGVIFWMLLIHIFLCCLRSWHEGRHCFPVGAEPVLQGVVPSACQLLSLKLDFICNSFVPDNLGSEPGAAAASVAPLHEAGTALKGNVPANSVPLAMGFRGHPLTRPHHAQGRPAELQLSASHRCSLVAQLLWKLPLQLLHHDAELTWQLLAGAAADLGFLRSVLAKSLAGAWRLPLSMQLGRIQAGAWGALCLGAWACMVLSQEPSFQNHLLP